MLGTRPESVARAIHAMTSDRVVAIQGRTVNIPKMGSLLAEVEAL